MSFNFGTPKPPGTPATTSGSSWTFKLSDTPTSTGGAGDTKQQAKPQPSLFSTPTASSTGFSLGTTPKTTPTFSFVTTTTSATLTSSLTVTPVASTATPQLSLGTSSAAATTSATAFTPIIATGSSLPSTTSVPTAAPLKLTTSLTPASTATTSTPSLGFGGIPATATQATAVTTATSTTTPAGSLTYAQLEDSINKWTIDLEEQGKFFINQAKQLNAWDHLLVSNSDKILGLNETIERIKQQQKQLDQELDFVLAQQNELEELSLPLEKQLADIPVTDMNRFQTYELSEIIDSQLKQMSEDLKEIIEHLNESNKEEDLSDPVTQISRILNAHMNSLQWIDRNTSQISSHLEQVSQLHETYKKNHLNF